MPRIDPERLLKCLQPLLEPASGAVKSTEEVDKILGLMSKFSKKLVSKCIYINILRASHPTVLDLFMQRGGWGLVYGWANEGANSKNYSLLKELITLLLQTPATVSRLKENKFPVLIKTLSKDCEDEETRNLAKQVVAKWISIAKNEESSRAEQPHNQVEVPVSNIGVIQQGTVVDQGGVSGSELGNLSMNADSLLNIDPSIMPDASMDFDISHTDLADIDFNIDILSAVDQHNLTESLPEVAPVQEHSIVKAEPTSVLVPNPNVVASNVPVTHPQVKEEVAEIIQVQPTPKILIKTVGGQRTVVHGSLASNTPEGQYCVLFKDGKNYLVKLKSEPKTISPMVVQEPVNAIFAKSSDLKQHDTTDSKEKLKSPRKDPGISTVNKVTGEPSLRTYGSKTKPAVNKSGVASQKKTSDQNAKPGEKSENKEKVRKISKENSSSSDPHKKSKSSSSGSKSAAVAIAKQLEEEKLREEIRKQKSLMKKRHKEAEKQKQQEKDQETLKKISLAVPTSTTPSSTLKMLKIPKKATSFADAIGIPGTDGAAAADKIKKISPEKSASKPEESPAPLSPPKKFYGRKEEPENTESDKPKERRHKVKVFQSVKSRSDELLKEMTETMKPKPTKEKEKEKEEVKPSITLGNSIPAVPPPAKPTKRLSTDSVEKPGDPKKAKLGESKPDKLKEGKESPSASKEKEKKKAPPPVVVLKESSLFMDILTAGTETPKSTKRKRRPSSSDKEPASPLEKSPKVQEKEGSESPKVQPHQVAASEEPVKPVFNFYRDTLNDDEEDQEPETKEPAKSSTENVESMEQDSEAGSFTPQENDGKLKSALCLIRARNRPKKFVRWREEEELREYHLFEMDETERVNVTKQKGFAELNQNDKAFERSMMRRKVDEDEEEKNEWRLVKISFKVDVLQPPILSVEKDIQDDRERNILGLFLPPGAMLPDTATEPDTTIPVDRVEPKFIPVEDVNSITKVCDYRSHTWPTPKDHVVGNMMRYGARVPEISDIPQNPILNAFPPTDYNPWNATLGFNVPPVPTPNMAPDMTPFSFPPPPTLNLNLIGSAPPPAVGFANPFAFPPPMVTQVNNGPPQGIVDPFSAAGRDHRMGNSNRGGRFNDGDRRNFHNRDRDAGRDRGGSRDREQRDDRGGRDRDRDRDYRRRDRDSNNDRDYRNYDRDRNSRDFRSGNRNTNIRKDIPCRYFKKGFCTNGNRCEFLHDASYSHDDDSRSNSHSRQDSVDVGRSRRSPETNADVDFRQSTDMDTSWEPSGSSVEQAEATSFALPPSSPTEPEAPDFSVAAESTKVIPV